MIGKARFEVIGVFTKVRICLGLRMIRIGTKFSLLDNTAVAVEFWLHSSLQPFLQLIFCCRRQSNTMNVEYHQHHTAIEHSHDSSLGRILQPALQSLSGLSSISRDALQKNLQPIMKALERLDAQLLLDLKSVKVGEGPRLNDRYVDEKREERCPRQASSSSRDAPDKFGF